MFSDQCGNAGYMQWPFVLYSTQMLFTMDVHCSTLICREIKMHALLFGSAALCTFVTSYIGGPFTMNSTIFAPTHDATVKCPNM